MDSSQSASAPSQSSVWGGFLKKAMEGVEQQLDRVLENPPTKAREAVAAAKKDTTPVQTKTGGGFSGRMTLQERLAASVAKSRTGSPRPGTTSEDVTVTTVQSSGEQQQMESNGFIKESGLNLSPPTDTQEIPASSMRIDTSSSEIKDLPSRTETPDLSVIPADNSTIPTPVDQTENLTNIDLTVVPSEPSESAIQDPSSERTSSVRLSTSLPPDTDPAMAELISQLRSDLAACESRRIEECEQATSRINSLETNLKILAQTTLDASKEVAENPTASPLERKLAEREEKIALLLDEGEKLAKIELTLMTTIKSLRAKQKEDATTTNTALIRAEKADKQLLDIKAQLKRANEIERKNTERLKGMYKIETVNEALRREKEAAQATIASLQNALTDAVIRADEAASQVQTEALEQERIANTELRERLERLSTEYSLSEEQFKSEISELKRRLEQEKLSAKTVQANLTSEINTLESKLEVLRTREEESSTSATSSAQAKLLRQIEMLQTQHAIAGQNWQRIEGSLQLRNENLEKEKNDLTRRWEDEKKKARDAIDSKREGQRQLDDFKREIKNLQDEVLKSQSQSQTFQETIHSLETRLADQESKFKREKESLQETFDITLDSRLKEEKTKWEEDQQSLYMSSPFSASFPQFSSPINSRPFPRNPKSPSPQPELSIKPRGAYPTRTTSYGDISHIRWPSRPFEVASPASIPAPQMPNLEDDDEREFLNNHRADSPRNAAFEAVSISASTSTAGPSVNIMERMSTAVRRLENDLVATKEELSRSTKQRDEAREECIKLMSEVEEKRRFQEAVQQAQAQYTELENRYNEALVLLGEKSERVEELQMDIVDLKEGYQHALQRLVGGN